MAELRTRTSREFDHTGDLGIEVEADSLAGAFEEAAMGMFVLISDPDAVKSVDRREVSVQGEDLAILMLNWLSELNFLHLTEKVLFGRFEIEKVSDDMLAAVVYGERIDRARHVIHTEIKAVTYHDLTVERRNDRWYARIIFDI